MSCERRWRERDRESMERVREAPIDLAFHHPTTHVIVDTRVVTGGPYAPWTLHKTVCAGLEFDTQRVDANARND